jgi:hypothetical protein
MGIILILINDKKSEENEEIDVIFVNVLKNETLLLVLN